MLRSSPYTTMTACQVILAWEEKLEHRIQSSGLSSQHSAPIEKLDSKIVDVRDAKEGEEAYAHLPEHEKEIIRRQLELPPIKVTFTTLYRYATRNDLIMIAVSSLGAIIGGAVMPLMTVSTRDAAGAGSKRLALFSGDPLDESTTRCDFQRS